MPVARRPRPIVIRTVSSRFVAARRAEDPRDGGQRAGDAHSGVRERNGHVGAGAHQYLHDRHRRVGCRDDKADGEHAALENRRRHRADATSAVEPGGCSRDAHTPRMPRHSDAVAEHRARAVQAAPTTPPGAL